MVLLLILHNMLNLTYIQNLRTQINNAPDCSALLKVSREILKYLNGMLSELNIQINILAPLLISPTDLGEVIGWINNMIAMIAGPYYKAMATYAQILALQAELIALLTTKIGSLSCNLSSFEAPSLPVPEFGVAMFGEAPFGA